MKKTTRPQSCQVNFSQPCCAKINNNQRYIIEFNPGSTLEITFKNLSYNHSAKVNVEIGSQLQRQVSLQPGQIQTKKYPISNFFSKITLSNQAVQADTLVQITCRKIHEITKIPLEYNKKINLYIQKQNGYIVSAAYERVVYVLSKEYFPQFNSSSSPIYLRLSGGSGVIKDGDTVIIETTETSVGDNKILGAWSTKALYYYTGGYKQQEWTIRKKIDNDSTIHYGDEVYFTNHYHQGQWLCVQDSGRWLTTKKEANVYWLID
ncbi:MAG: hypothetical protein F6J86_39385 [Symploca sp. SIO1B1]|nr:hypothetical protein [Symploca sp. SIO1B1]